MFKKRILYTDIPHHYDDEARQSVKFAGVVMLACILSAVCLIAMKLF